MKNSFVSPGLLAGLESRIMSILEKTGHAGKLATATDQASLERAPEEAGLKVG